MTPISSLATMLLTQYLFLLYRKYILYISVLLSLPLSLSLISNKLQWTRTHFWSHPQHHVPGVGPYSGKVALLSYHGHRVSDGSGQAHSPRTLRPTKCRRRSQAPAAPVPEECSPGIPDRVSQQAFTVWTTSDILSREYDKNYLPRWGQMLVFMEAPRHTEMLHMINCYLRQFPSSTNWGRHVLCPHCLLPQDIREILQAPFTYFTGPDLSFTALTAARGRCYPRRAAGRFHSGQPASPGPGSAQLPDVPSGLLYSHSFFVLGWIMLLAEA